MVVSPRVSRRKLAAALPAIGLLGQVHARLHARVRVGVVEEDGGETPDVLRALPAGDLVVVELGQFVPERRLLGVLVDLRLPAIGDRRRQPGAGDHRRRAEQAARDSLASESSGASGPHSATSCSVCEAATSISEVKRGPAPHSAATSSAATVM